MCGGLSWRGCPPLSLRGQTLCDEYAGLRRVLPDWPDRCIGRRVIPLTRLLYAVERDDHDPALWRIALESLNFAGTNDVVMVEKGASVAASLSP